MWLVLCNVGSIDQLVKNLMMADEASWPLFNTHHVKMMKVALVRKSTLHEICSFITQKMVIYLVIT